MPANLNYSTRTAQKLMRAAETWDSWPKSEPGSVLPKPTVIYALSAPSVPQEIRELYAPRVTAGEDVLAEVRKLIKQRSRKIKEMNKNTCHGAGSSEPEKARVADAAYLPTGSRKATGSEHGRLRCNEGLRGLTKADSLAA